jgi:hypothetical protein
VLYQAELPRQTSRIIILYHLGHLVKLLSSVKTRFTLAIIAHSAPKVKCS